MKVEGHPTLVTQSYLFLRKTKTFKDVRLCVAPNKPQILLWKNRLYMHEYLTHPPLRKLRVYIKDDEGPLQEDDDDVTVAFVVSGRFSSLYRFEMYSVPLRFYRSQTLKVSH